MIAIYIVTKNMTVEQHTKGRDRLRDAGAPKSAMKLHSCFGATRTTNPGLRSLPVMRWVQPLGRYPRPHFIAQRR